MSLTTQKDNKMADNKKKKTTKQVIAEGEAAARAQRDATAAVRNARPKVNGQTNYDADLDTDSVKAQLEATAAERKLAKEQEAKDKANEVTPYVGPKASAQRRGKAPAGWGTGADASVPTPTVDTTSGTYGIPRGVHSVPTAIAEGMPHKGTPFSNGTSAYAMPKGKGFVEPLASPDERSTASIAEEHLKNAMMAHAQGDLANLALHKQKLHSLYRKSGQPSLSPALCKNDDCANPVHVTDYEKHDVGSAIADEMSERMHGDTPCRSCFAQGRD